MTLIFSCLRFHFPAERTGVENALSSLWNLLKRSITQTDRRRRRGVAVLRWTLKIFFSLFFCCHQVLNLLKIPFNTQVVLLACSCVCESVDVFVCGTFDQRFPWEILVCINHGNSDLRVCVRVCEQAYKYVFSVCLSMFPRVCPTEWVCCLYCVVYLVLPYLNNKTGYEIQN